MTNVASDFFIFTRDDGLTFEATDVDQKIPDGAVILLLVMISGTYNDGGCPELITQEFGGGEGKTTSSLAEEVKRISKEHAKKDPSGLWLRAWQAKYGNIEPPHHWSFSAELTDIDVGRACEELREAGARYGAVTVPNGRVFVFAFSEDVERSFGEHEYFERAYPQYYTRNGSPRKMTDRGSVSFEWHNGGSTFFVSSRIKQESFENEAEAQEALDALRDWFAARDAERAKKHRVVVRGW